MDKKKMEIMRTNLQRNIIWLASNFKSHALLSRLLNAQPKFVSRVVNTPREISLSTASIVGVKLGITDDVLFGELEHFKQALNKWVLDTHEKIKKIKRSKKNGKRRN